MTWLVDPATREPLPPIPGMERERAYNATHWRPGWHSRVVREDGIPVRIAFSQCLEDCCADYRANLPPLESLR